MSVVDSADLVIDALTAIFDADVELRALTGRTSKIVIPFESLQSAPGSDVIALQITNDGDGPAGRELDLTLSCCAALPTDARKLSARAQYLLATAGVTFQLFAGHSLEVVPNAAKRPTKNATGTQSEVGDSTEGRVDLLISLMIPD